MKFFKLKKIIFIFFVLCFVFGSVFSYGAGDVNISVKYETNVLKDSLCKLECCVEAPDAIEVSYKWKSIPVYGTIEDSSYLFNETENILVVDTSELGVQWFTCLVSVDYGEGAPKSYFSEIVKVSVVNEFTAKPTEKVTPTAKPTEEPSSTEKPSEEPTPTEDPSEEASDTPAEKTPVVLPTNNPSEESKKNGSDIIIYVVLGVVAFVVLITFISMLKKKKKQVETKKSTKKTSKTNTKKPNKSKNTKGKSLK